MKILYKILHIKFNILLILKLLISKDGNEDKVVWNRSACGYLHLKA